MYVCMYVCMYRYMYTVYCVIYCRIIAIATKSYTIDISWRYSDAL